MSRAICCLLVLVIGSHTIAEDSSDVLATHCADCHSADLAEGGFRLSMLGTKPDAASAAKWVSALERVTAGEMPPDQDLLTDAERRAVSTHLTERLAKYAQASTPERALRRLNNREFENSVRDVLLIEDIGTHQPTTDLIGDARHHGFDTHGETLGFSRFHLEQYVVAARKIVDANVLSGPRPESHIYKIAPTDILSARGAQNTQRRDRRGTEEGFDFLDPKQHAYFEPFPVVPTSGRYQLTLTCVGMDRGVYPESETGIFAADPIRIEVVLGDRIRTFDLPDDEPVTLRLDEWLAAGTRVRLRYPTDGLTLRGNGNFKFQNAIAGEYLKMHDIERYREVYQNSKFRTGPRKLGPRSWQHWVDEWRGPRPRVLSATVTGPTYESWPPTRQTALLGTSPKSSEALAILTPIATRAWRREVRPGELDAIVDLVHRQSERVGEIEALKEGVVAILVSPQFLFVQRDDLSEQQRFASKLALVFGGSIPSADLTRRVQRGDLESVPAIRDEIRRRIESGSADAFLEAFPTAWFGLDDINFMAPDPDAYEHYHRKRVSEDMVSEVLHLFEHVATKNAPVTELVSADYSFVNADLADVYGLTDVPRDSTFRQVTFDDRRRGGLLGTGAFLTVTADTLTTSPIDRAVYVMENVLGVTPTPPPPDVEITEPDVRQAATIKEVLEKHRSDATCASCHQRLDAFGYAFENFGPTGAWRDTYAADATGATIAAPKRKQAGVPIDASAEFSDGTAYRNVEEFRALLLTDTNRRRFARCFVTKFLTYANGEEPSAADALAIEEIVDRAAESKYRMLDTLAVVIDSRLFRDR